MYLVVNDPFWEEILGQAVRMHYKLILVVGPSGSGKTKALKEAGYGTGYLNLGEELSRKLSTVPVHLRAVEAESIASDLIDAVGTDRVAIDNTEILFEAPLSMDPLKFLKQASCHRVIVASWTGQFDKNNLHYGIQGHPAYRHYTYTQEDTFLIVPTGKQP